ncbi:MAG: YceI family protein [Ardenticatenaceae bacterium]|nr:YceI family protein [Ardenticatenaceae bacterium]
MMKMIRLLMSMFVLAVLVACTGGGAPAEPTAAPVQAPAEEASQPETTAAETAVLPIGSGTDEVRTFVIDPTQSKASFLVDEEFFAGAFAKLGIEAGLADVVGSTQEVAGELSLNFANPGLLEAGTITVQTGSLKTDQNRRDEWLQDNALEKKKFPTATFVATSISGLPDSYTPGSELSFELNGDLTVRDVTKPVTFAVTAVLNGDTLTGKATLPTRMTDYGIEPPNFANTLTVADEFVIEVDITAKEQQ